MADIHWIPTAEALPPLVHNHPRALGLLHPPGAQYSAVVQVALNKGKLATDFLVAHPARGAPYFNTYRERVSHWAPLLTHPLPATAQLTTEQWLARCAARLKERLECDDDFAMETAKACLESRDDELDTPEDTADEELSCWTDDEGPTP